MRFSKTLFTFALFSSIGGLWAPLLAQEPKVGPETSLLRVNITSQGWNFFLPWQKQQPDTRRGLGALIDGNRVLVTAELAQDASYVELEIGASGKRLAAKVEVIDYECNLATIVAAEEAGDFFDGLKPLEISTDIPLKDKLQVWQFEANGSPVSTDIEFTRAELGQYFLKGERFLIFEATGGVHYRAGTFTLPVAHNGKLAGMLLSYSSKDEVAEILPGVIIRRFLDDSMDGKYDGFPQFGVKISATLDQQFRNYLKLGKDDGGVYVSKVFPGTSAEKGGLKVGDVILEISGNKIDSRGNYEHPQYGLLSMGHLTKGSAKIGEVLKMKILRDGMAQDIEVPMLRKAPSEYLVDPYMFDRGPKYTILGGLLFQELTEPFLNAGGENRNSPFLLGYARDNPEEFEKEGRKKLVFLSGVLPAESNQGYERLRSLIVTRVNGQFISDIKALDAALKNPVDGVHKIEFSEYPKVIFIDAAQAAEDNKTTMAQRYRITKLQRLD